jgi:putative endonuclease
MQTTGRKIESLAREYLERQGLTFVISNYRCSCGEIDLIMRDQNTLVFIEVRYRCQNHYGEGVATINLTKQRKLKKTAVYYLQKHRLYGRAACRFDIVSVSGKQEYAIDWIRDAFWEKW